MYYAIVAALMLILPLLSIAIDAGAQHAGPLWPLVGKWFVFWSVGLRLLLAGLRQMLQPRYTAEKILGLKDEDALLVIRELGFANVSIGTIGLISLWVPAWTTAAALAGGIFYGLAGLNHLRVAHRNRLENVAMVSDLFVGAILLVYSARMSFH
jgi:hypothetical protein